ncbi:MAG: ABC transporter permease [Clostridia bacterium]|nr:ABC transporter permease [Clostridia bacterium]
MKSIDIRGKLYAYRQIVILLALCMIFAILLPGTFLSAGNFVNILYAISLQGIMICGATFPVLIAGIDRTVSGSAALSGAVCCTIILNSGFSDQGIIMGVLAGLGVGLLSGLFHGLVLMRFDIPAFLLTLATSEILYGLVQSVTGNQLINVMRADKFTTIGTLRVMGVPVTVFILAACFIFTYIILNKTVYGRHLYCVGGNREAAKLSGINVRKIIVIAYMISGFMGALSGLVLSSMNQQASANQAKGYENDVLAAIVVGGISLRGGSGTIQGAMFGALLIGILSNGLRLLGVDSVYHDLIKGVIIIIAVAIDMYSSYKRSGLKHAGFFKRLAGVRNSGRAGG